MTREDFLQQLPNLVKNYKPAPEVLARIAKVDLLMIVGPSGVGKTTLIQESGLPFVPSDTTRQPRAGEQDGIDFYFRKDYNRLVQDIGSRRFVQIAIGATGDLYSTKATSYPDSGLATMPVVADVVPFFRKLGFASTISAFITPPSCEEWMRRLSTHKMTKEQLTKRLNEAKRSFELALNDGQTHFILNDEVGLAEKQIENLLDGKIDPQREARAREAAKNNLQELIDEL